MTPRCLVYFLVVLLFLPSVASAQTPQADSQSTPKFHAVEEARLPPQEQRDTLKAKSQPFSATQPEQRDGSLWKGLYFIIPTVVAVLALLLNFWQYLKRKKIERMKLIFPPVQK